MAALPYNPWRILSPSSNSTSLYIFQPPTSTTVSSQLLSLDITRTLNSASLAVQTISSSLPFMRKERTQAYTSAINGDGSIIVYTGSCGEGSEASDLWRFSPDQGSTPSSGTLGSARCTYRPNSNSIKYPGYTVLVVSCLLCCNT